MQQRFRWAKGTLQTIFSSTNPFTIKGLSLFQRIIHFYGIFHYLTYPFYIVILIIPLFYFFLGWAPFKASYNQVIFFFLPFFFFNAITFSWICNEYSSKLSSFVAESFMCVPLSKVVLKTLIDPFSKKFRVTRKELYRKKINFNKTVGIPLVLFFSMLTFWHPSKTNAVLFGCHGWNVWLRSKVLPEMLRPSTERAKTKGASKILKWLFSIRISWW